MRSSHFLITLLTTIAVVFVYDLIARPPAAGPEADGNPVPGSQAPGESRPADSADPRARPREPDAPPALVTNPTGVRATESRQLRDELARLGRRLDRAEDHLRQHEVAIGALKQAPPERIALVEGARPTDVAAFRALHRAMLDEDRRDRVYSQTLEWLGRERADGVSDEAALTAAEALLRLRDETMLTPGPVAPDFERAVLAAISTVVKEPQVKEVARAIGALLLAGRPGKEDRRARLVAGAPVGDDD